MRRKTEESGTTSTACRNGTDKEAQPHFYAKQKVSPYELRSSNNEMCSFGVETRIDEQLRGKMRIRLLVRMNLSMLLMEEMLLTVVQITTMTRLLTALIETALIEIALIETALNEYALIETAGVADEYSKLYLIELTGKCFKK